MKYFLPLIVLFSTACFANTAERIAIQYVTLLAKQDFKSAASMIYCSEQLNESQVLAEHAGLEKELKFLDQEFGTISHYRTSSNNLYVAATLGCAPHEYLKAHLPSVKKIIIEVMYDGKERGYIIVGLMLKEGKYFPLVVDHGIPMSGPSSAARIMNVYKKLTDL